MLKQCFNKELAIFRRNFVREVVIYDCRGAQEAAHRVKSLVHFMPAESQVQIDTRVVAKDQYVAAGF